MEEEARTNDRNQFLDGAVVLVGSIGTLKDEETKWQPQLLIHHEYLVDDVPGQLSTKQTGTIEIISDGKQMWMVGER